MVTDGILTLRQIAERMGMTESKFKAAVKKSGHSSVAPRYFSNRYGEIDFLLQNKTDIIPAFLLRVVMYVILENEVTAMGMYFNPSNDVFKQALNSQIYVDKTGMIGFVNSIINTEQKFAAVSRARRFGKSMAAKLLVAYYVMDFVVKYVFAQYCIHNIHIIFSEAQNEQRS